MITQRVATRSNQATGAREDATFIEMADHELFCVVHRPASTPDVGVIFCPSLFAEEQKMYGAQVLTARALADAGFAAVRFHYRGTGHSSGVIDTLTVDTMLEDVGRARAYLEETTGVKAIGFCGGRFGGLVAALAAPAHQAAALILWEPVLDGRAYFRDIFRASQLSALAGGTSGLTVGSAVDRLREAGTVDVLGSPICLPLYESAVERKMADVTLRGPLPALLIQINPSQHLKPEYTALKDALGRGGVSLETVLIEGEGAWSFVDSPMPSPHKIAEVTQSWLTRALHQQAS